VHEAKKGLRIRKAQRFMEGSRWGQKGRDGPHVPGTSTSGSASGNGNAANLLALRETDGLLAIFPESGRSLANSPEVAADPGPSEPADAGRMRSASMKKTQQEFALPVIWLPGLVGLFVISAVVGIVMLMAPRLPEDRAEDVARADAELARRIPVIREEITRLGPDHAWAGEYYEGDGLGRNISFLLAPQAGCVATSSGCLGLYGANWGTVTEQDGMLRIVFDLPRTAGEFGHFVSVFHVERDGESTRIVPDRESSDSRYALLRQ
jgi:hypothetical protein